MTTKSRTTFKKILSWASTVVTFIIIALAIAVIINVIVAKKQDKPVSFFGVSCAVVLSASMEPEIMTGDLIAFEEYDYESLQVGDIIVFVGGSGFGEREGENIVHKIIAITENGIKTQGVNNGVADTDLVTEDNYVGKYTGFHSAFFGGLVSFLSSWGVPIIIIIVALPFIIKQIIKIIKLSKESGNGEASSEENALQGGLSDEDAPSDDTDKK